MLKRISYISRFVRPLNAAEVEAIARRSAANNATRGITGVLMTSGQLFFQVLEGPEAEVDALFRAIAEDERHTDVMLLGSLANVTERAFPDWAMARVSLEDDAAERLEPVRVLLENALQQRRLLDQSVGVIQRAAWRELRGA